MGFYIMVLSLLFGILLIVFGRSDIKRQFWHKTSLVVGILLVLFAIYLGLPK